MTDPEILVDPVTCRQTGEFSGLVRSRTDPGRWHFVCHAAALGWRCTCPASVRDCAHVRSCRVLFES